MADLVMLGAASAAAIFVFGSRRRARKVVVEKVQPETIEQPQVEDDPLERIAELLDEHLSDEAHNGFLYQIVRGDTLESVARTVLDKMKGPYTEQMLLDYIHCISSGTFNLGRYGTPSTTKRFPSKWLAPGIQKGLRVAFLPRNQDALALIRSGIMPKMVVDPRTGAPRGSASDSHYGLIWLPPIDPTDFESGIISCAPYSWEDGSSTIDPDPELLALVA